MPEAWVGNKDRAFWSLLLGVCGSRREDLQPFAGPIWPSRAKGCSHLQSW